jgi:hypothetical protein
VKTVKMMLFYIVLESIFRDYARNIRFLGNLEYNIDGTRKMGRDMNRSREMPQWHLINTIVTEKGVRISQITP